MVATFFLGFGAIPWVITMQHHNLRVNLLALSDLLEWVTQNVKKFGVEYLRVISVALVMIFPFCCDMHYLILPVNIKSLAGSNATLANWFFFLGGYNDCKFARLGAVEEPSFTCLCVLSLWHL
ncbi:hypothetical protein L1049_016517 [Liquidambar formosana]|uniref:Uncharacterized protein n=1 Tax=Liquidambar formosana TaxID=63359 RepID=A0AAP0X357_LIQFO